MPNPKVTPDWRFVAYPHSAIPNWQVNGFAVTDLMQDILAESQAAGAGVWRRGSDPRGWSDWSNLVRDLSVQNVNFAHFDPSGRVHR